jgi:hypothetical protein
MFVQGSVNYDEEEATFLWSRIADIDRATTPYRSKRSMNASAKPSRVDSVANIATCPSAIADRRPQPSEPTNWSYAAIPTSSIESGDTNWRAACGLSVAGWSPSGLRSGLGQRIKREV